MTQPTETKSSDAAPAQTFAGCVMTERDYRSAHKLGAGEAGGVGLGDEFVLVDVKISPAKATGGATPASDTSPTVKTESTIAAKCADQGTAYRLTGSDEEKLKDVVGRQIEVQGRFKNADEVSAAGARPEGTLPVEVEMISFREVPAPATATAPTTAQTTTPSSPPIAPPPAAQATPPPPPPPTPAATIEPRQDTTPAATARRELPQTAGSAGLYALAGVLALGSGLALTALRRRLL